MAHEPKIVKMLTSLMDANEQLQGQLATVNRQLESIDQRVKGVEQDIGAMKFTMERTKEDSRNMADQIARQSNHIGRLQSRMDDRQHFHDAFPPGQGSRPYEPVANPKVRPGLSLLERERDKIDKHPW